MEAMERVAYELCEDQAAGGVLYFEARYCPHLVLDDSAFQDGKLLGIVSRRLLLRFFFPLQTSIFYNFLFSGIPDMEGAREVIRAVNRGLKRGKEEFGVDSRSILVCIRGISRRLTF